MNVTPIHESARCENCAVPLTKSYGCWVHHWIYRNACKSPKLIPGTERSSERD